LGCVPDDVSLSPESPCLSSLSIGSNERAPSATPSESSDRRPLSLVSTLSSGSWSSREDTIPPPDPVPSPEGEGSDSKGRSLGLEHKNNNNNNTDASETAATWGQNRALSRRQQPAVAMAPSAQLTYLDRVVMEIIETERMYVRDLRMIVEVRHTSSSVARSHGIS
ncbi:pleckstrin homology domain-containing family G member 3-like, partial [Etheostoma cragini]|uniref:pleckstrin homology domain-containing family G member 3-like n=1 Tax=Etheostoma cragini TaxID=417921 RepID=UPI00155F1379